MPFDSLPEITHTMLQPPYRWGNEKLARLEMLLRTDFETTHRHRWWFRDCLEVADCGTAGCALGLAILEFKSDDACWAGFYDIPLRVRDRLFLCPGGSAIGYGRIPALAVTPLMVADAIRRYMTTGEV
jgi:hypothetical protein